MVNFRVFTDLLQLLLICLVLFFLGGSSQSGAYLLPFVVDFQRVCLIQVNFFYFLIDAVFVCPLRQFDVGELVLPFYFIYLVILSCHLILYIW